MKPRFSPSINVLRDEGEDFGYIPTENAKRIAEEILQSERTGTHAFQVIGSYGTGKSAFLLALTNSLLGKAQHFPFKAGKRPPAVVNLTGEYGSLIGHLADHFEVKRDKKDFRQVLDAIHERYEQHGRLFLIIDEFGKFLEYAAKHDPEREMFFFQQLAEFVNKPDRNITLIVTLHQSMEAYAHGFTAAQRMEWRKVHGRLRELTFNEPTAQLIRLAAEQLSKQRQAVPKGAPVDLFPGLIKEHTLFDVDEEGWSKEELTKLYPLDLVAVHVLTKALQAYGQNERSLFTFLRSERIHPRRDGGFFGLPQLFDYLNSEFYTFLRSAGNPHRNRWEMLWSALERVDAAFGKKREPYEDLIKTIGLVQLFGGQGAAVNDVFISAYAKAVWGAKSVAEQLKELQQKKLVLFVKHRASYRMTEGTDLDFEAALQEASAQVEEITDLVERLRPHFKRQFVLAKEATYHTGTPRIFEYVLSEQPITGKPKGAVDGYINLVFNTRLSEGKLKEHSAVIADAIVYGLFKHTDSIRECLMAIDRAQHVIEQNEEDRVAVKELRNIQQHHEALLDHYVHEALFSGGKHGVKWVALGGDAELLNERQFNRKLSEVVHQVYPESPIYRNELINREKVSPTASTARKALFDRVAEHWELPDLGFLGNEFPAERAIYTTLLKENGIHRKTKDGWELCAPEKGSSFQPLWKVCEDFLAESRHSRKGIDELMERLAERPFKLKYGLVELWVPLFLFIKRGDFALYRDDAFIPELNGTIMYEMTRQPRSFQVKAFAVDGIRLKLFNKYKAFLGKEEVKNLSNGELIDVTRPFLAFYRSLNAYTQQTDKLSPEAKALREAIKNATDPERTFFEDLPNALRMSLEELDRSDEQLGKFIGFLSAAIDDLQQAAPRLVERIDTFIGDEVLGTGARFPETRTLLAKRLSSIREHQLLDHLKPLFKRSMAPLDQADAWISSVAEGALGKALNKFTDRDEDILKERLAGLYRELINLAELQQVEEDPAEAPALRLNITTSAKGTRTETIEYPLKKKAQVDKLVRELKDRLKGDPSIDRAALAWLLNEELNKG
jgi:DNA replication protein DnaC